MSRYIPTFDGSNRWLEDGKTLPSATLKTEMDAVKTAEDANATVYDGGANLSLRVGMGIRYDVADRAFNKLWAFDDCGADDEYIIRDAAVADTTLLVPGDTANDFQTVKLTKDCKAFGKKMMLLEVLAYGFDNAALATNYVTHPAAAAEATEFVIRESSLPVDANGDPDPSDGQHPFSSGLTAADAADGLVQLMGSTVTGAAATETRRAYVAMRNLNNSFSFRVGSTLSDATTDGEILVRVLEAWD